MRSIGRSVVTVAAVALMMAPSLEAQTRRRGTEPLPPKPGAPATPAPQPGSTPGTRAETPAPNTSSAAVSIQQRNVALSKSQIDTVSKQLTSASGKKPARFGLGMLKGDENREAAAKQMLEAQASQEAGKGMTTIVVIGNEGDVTKVKESLAESQRDVLLLFVDDSISDETTDNAALRGGLAGKVTGMASNMWLYLPSSGNAAARKPNQTLSTKVATPKLWSGIFTANGDVPVEAQNLLNGQGLRGNQDAKPAAAEAPAASGAAASAAKAGGAFAEGDVLGPKIAGVRLMATPEDAGKVTATLTRTDEVVVLGAEKNGYVNVQGPAAAGWVKATLMQKK